MKDSYIFYTNKLQGEYAEVFDQIQFYVNSYAIDDDTKEDLLCNLLDSFLMAQGENRSVYDITGNNIPNFCNSFCSEFSSQNRLLYMLDLVKHCSWIIFITSIFSFADFHDVSKRNDVSIWTYSGNFNITGYILAVMALVLLVSIINLFVRKKITHNKTVSAKFKTVSSLFLLGIMIFLFYSITEWNVTNFFSIPCWILALISGSYLFIYYTLNHKRLSSRNKIKFTDLIELDTTITESIEKEMTKKFKKKNEKRSKKGLEALSFPDFLQEEKACEKTYKLKYFYIALPIIIVAPMCIFGEFEGILDLILYASILLLIEYAIMIFLWQSVSSDLKQRQTYIAHKRKEATT